MTTLIPIDLPLATLQRLELAADRQTSLTEDWAIEPRPSTRRTYILQRGATKHFKRLWVEAKAAERPLLLGPLPLAPTPNKS